MDYGWRNDVANVVTGSFHIKKLCSELSIEEVEFYWQNSKSHFVPPFGGLIGVTYTVHLYGSLESAFNFLLVLIAHFSLALTVEALYI